MVADRHQGKRQVCQLDQRYIKVSQDLSCSRAVHLGRLNQFLGIVLKVGRRKKMANADAKYSSPIPNNVSTTPSWLSVM
jgi:hypothetical protein